MYPSTGMTKAEVMNYLVQVAPGAARPAQGPARDPDPVARRRGGREVLREEHAARRPGLGPSAEAAGRARAPRTRAPSWSCRSSTTSPGSCGRRTRGRSSCTRRSGASARAARSTSPTGWSSTSTRAPRPGWTSARRSPTSSPTGCARTGSTRPCPSRPGSKGMQLYAPLPGTQTVMEIRQYARDLAYEIAAAHPRPGRRDHEEGPARRQGAHRLVAEPPGQDDDHAVLAARARRRRTSPRRAGGTRSGRGCSS